MCFLKRVYFISFKYSVKFQPIFTILSLLKNGITNKITSFLKAYLFTSGKYE